jgi:hypothetical protein
MAKTFAITCSINMSPPIGDPIPTKVYENLSEKDVVHLERYSVNFLNKLTQIGEDIASGKAVEPVKLPARSYVRVDFSIVDTEKGQEWAGMELRYPNLDRTTVEMLNGMIEGELGGTRDDVKKKRRHNPGKH